jgi:hypothetical protein
MFGAARGYARAPAARSGGVRYFAAFPSRASHFFASLRTFFGAVPP